MRPNCNEGDAKIDCWRLHLVFASELDNMDVVKTVGRLDAPSPTRAADAPSDASTRQRILDLLLANGTMTAAEIAAALDLTTTGIRRHLAVLTENGQISAHDQQGARGRGRPAKSYALTAAGRAGFGQAYDELALNAMAELIAAAGPDAIDRLTEKRLAEVCDDFRRRRAAEPAADGTQLLADALNAAGYFASAAPDGELCQHHCPVAHVAERFPQLCEAETTIFARLLGADLSRSATIADGDRACRTHRGRPTLLPNPVSADRKVNS